MAFENFSVDLPCNLRSVEPWCPSNSSFGMEGTGNSWQWAYRYCLAPQSSVAISCDDAGTHDYVGL